MAKKQVVGLLKRYISLLNNEGIEVKNAYLYGSYLNGTETSDSDIDLLLILKDLEVESDNLFGKIWALTRKIDNRIEPYIIGFDRFINDDVSPLLQVVKKDGLKII